jgi:hypothetical protein
MDQKPVDPVTELVKELPKISRRIRAVFQSEMYFRLFVVAQGMGVIGLLYLWFGYFGWNPMDLFESVYWATNLNWLAVFAVFGPFAVFKSIDWIVSAKR